MRLKLFKVTGNSMLPTLAEGDFVLAFRRARQVLDVGDCVVIDHSEFGLIVKRITRILPSGNLNVAGDNLAMSTQSERLGLVPRDRVLGKVLLPIHGPGHRLATETTQRTAWIDDAMTQRRPGSEKSKRVR